jgi:hypothetical protein
MAEDEEPNFERRVISDAELDRFLADLGAHPLAELELRQLTERVYVSLSPRRVRVSIMPSALARAGACTSSSGEPPDARLKRLQAPSSGGREGFPFGQ